MCNIKYMFCYFTFYVYLLSYIILSIYIYFNLSNSSMGTLIRCYSPFSNFV